MIGAARSAGGAPLDQLAALAAVYGGGTLGLIWLVEAHRRGRTRLLASAGELAGMAFRLPGWAALPVFVGVVSLLCLTYGGYWDIGYHIDVGRDEGPLGNPGHWPMLFGFFGTFAAGVLCIGLVHGEPARPTWVRIGARRGSGGEPLRVPTGGLLIIVCAAFGMLALPLDDVWHRIFGQDVTLWSPTHFMLLGGAVMSVIGMAVLVAEGARARERRRGAPDSLPARVGVLWRRVQRVALLGGMLMGLEAFLAEYDWGVPLYRQVWQPLLLAASAGLVLSAARIWGGRGGALGAWGIYMLVRLSATLMPVLAGRSPSWMPLLLVEAAFVELAALALDPRTRPLAFGALAGLLCGTAGFAGEYAWSQLAMPLPWATALLPEGLPTAALAGVAGGVLGGLLGSGLRGGLPPPRVARAACLGALAVLVALGVSAGIRELPQARAHVELRDVQPEPDRQALASVRLEPDDAADGANWLYLLAWQGGDDRVVDRLERVGQGVYRSTKPIPLSGSWKVGLRLQRGRERGAVPIRLPADDAMPGAGRRLPASFDREAITRGLREWPGAELRAPASFTRPFTDDSLIVLRETKSDVPGWLWAASIALILALYAAFIACLAVGVAHVARSGAKAGRMVATTPQ